MADPQRDPYCIFAIFVVSDPLDITLAKIHILLRTMEDAEPTMASCFADAIG